MEALLAARPSPNVIAECFGARAVDAHASYFGLVAAFTGASNIAELDQAICGAHAVVPACGIVGVAPAVVGVCACQQSGEDSSCLSDG